MDQVPRVTRKEKRMFDSILFYLSAFMTVVGAVLVVFERNLMHACVFLLTSLLGVAGLYLTLGAEFVAGTQLVVYVGGVVILMLFAVMLTGGGLEEVKKGVINFELVPSMGNLATYVWGLLTAILFMLIGVDILRSVFSTGLVKENPVTFTNTVEEIGTKLLTDHVLMFEMSSVLLVGALIGAAIISRPTRSNSKGETNVSN